MASTSDFRNGLILNHKNGLWKIIEFLHVKPGKGPAFVRTKLKNVKTGQIVDETFRAGQKIETVRIESKDYNFLYQDSDLYYFMDSETYEQISLTSTQIDQNIKDFLIENVSTTIVFDKDDPIEVRLPSHLNVEIIKTDPGEKGNTAQGGTKPATISSGLSISVPLFIQEGDIVRVDTRDKRYLERVNKWDLNLR